MKWQIFRPGITHHPSVPLSDGKLDRPFQRRNLVCMKLFSEGIIRLRNMLTMKRLSIQAETGKRHLVKLKEAHTEFLEHDFMV